MTVLYLNPFYSEVCYLRNELNFWNVHGIMTTLGLFCKVSEALWASLTLQETRITCIHGSINRPKLIFTFYYKYLKYKNYL